MPVAPDLGRHARGISGLALNKSERSCPASDFGSLDNIGRHRAISGSNSAAERRNEVPRARRRASRPTARID